MIVKVISSEKMADALVDAPLKVSQLVAMLKADVEEKHHHVRVLGELSSFKQWRSGHCYFDIKDDQAVLPAVMFRPHFAKVPFAVSDGLLVLFTGRISIYPANSRLQMIVESMEPLGQGALALAFEQLKEKLKAEGLFDDQHKKPVKAFNQTIGIITSSHGAVLRDMVRILKSRMPKVDILFSSVRVQGAGASLEIKTAIELLDQMGACDVIIVGRGGGSLEDLWAFNEEIVARAIFKAKTPMISAVGHETDVTISDFVADIRAATPTHAATLAVPDIRDILAHLASSLAALKQQERGYLTKALLCLAEEKKRIKDPRLWLFKHWQRLDELGRKLSELIREKLHKEKTHCGNEKNRLQQLAPIRQLRLKKDGLFALKTALLAKSPIHALVNQKQMLKASQQLLTELMYARLRAGQKDFSNQVVKFDALSPLTVLSRGFSVITAADSGRVLNKKADFLLKEIIKIRIEDGVITAQITGKE